MHREHKHFNRMATLTLQVDNSTILDSLKKILSLMKGVRVIAIDNDPEPTATADIPNKTTLDAMKEAESGKDAGVVDISSIDSFIASME